MLLIVDLIELNLLGNMINHQWLLFFVIYCSLPWQADWWRQPPILININRHGANGD